MGNGESRSSSTGSSLADREKLEQTNVSTLRRYVTAAQVPLGRNPRKDACVSALLDKVFPVAARFCRSL